MLGFCWSRVSWHGRYLGCQDRVSACHTCPLSCDSRRRGHGADFLALNQINHKLLKGKHCISLVIPIKMIFNGPSLAVQRVLPKVDPAGG